MKLVVWIRRHASLVWIAVLGLATMGAVSIFQLPSGIYPEMQFPRVIVVAKAGQLSPDLVEAQMTRPLEQALAVVPGVRHVRARTIRGAVELSLQLTDGTDPLTAQYACQAAVDHVELPRGTTTVVQRVLPTSVPVITLNVVPTKGIPTDLRRLREVAERIIRPAIVRVSGVGGVEVAGGRVRQVQLVIHPTELAALRLTPEQLAQKIEAEDQVIAVGRVWDQHQTLPVVYDAQAADLEQLRALPIATGILLLENAQHHLAEGLDLEAALIAAARRRLRPILMTTAATLAGLAPLAFGLGAGAELQRPLAVAVIGGLTLATLVTLVVTPGLTALLARQTQHAPRT